MWGTIKCFKFSSRIKLILFGASLNAKDCQDCNAIHCAGSEINDVVLHLIKKDARLRVVIGCI